MRIRYYLFLIVLFAFACVGCGADDADGYGRLPSTYTSDDCIRKTYRKESLSGKVTITTVSDCYGEREVSEFVIH